MIERLDFVRRLASFPRDDGLLYLHRGEDRTLITGLHRAVSLEVLPTFQSSIVDLHVLLTFILRPLR